MLILLLAPIFATENFEIKFSVARNYFQVNTTDLNKHTGPYLVQCIGAQEIYFKFDCSKEKNNTDHVCERDSLMCEKYTYKSYIFNINKVLTFPERIKQIRSHVKNMLCDKVIVNNEVTWDCFMFSLNKRLSANMYCDTGNNYMLTDNCILSFKTHNDITNVRELIFHKDKSIVNYGKGEKIGKSQMVLLDKNMKDESSMPRYVICHRDSKEWNWNCTIDKTLKYEITNYSIHCEFGSNIESCYITYHLRSRYTNLNDINSLTFHKNEITTSRINIFYNQTICVDGCDKKNVIEIICIKDYSDSNGKIIDTMDKIKNNVLPCNGCSWICEASDAHPFMITNYTISCEQIRSLNTLEILNNSCYITYSLQFNTTRAICFGLIYVLMTSILVCVKEVIKNQNKKQQNKNKEVIKKYLETKEIDFKENDITILKKDQAEQNLETKENDSKENEITISKKSFAEEIAEGYKRVLLNPRTNTK